jgi:hypothetical protein
VWTIVVFDAVNYSLTLNYVELVLLIVVSIKNLFVPFCHVLLYVGFHLVHKVHPWLVMDCVLFCVLQT